MTPNSAASAAIPAVGSPAESRFSSARASRTARALPSWEGWESGSTGIASCPGGEGMRSERGKQVRAVRAGRHVLQAPRRHAWWLHGCMSAEATWRLEASTECDVCGPAVSAMERRADLPHPDPDQSRARLAARTVIFPAMPRAVASYLVPDIAKAPRHHASSIIIEWYARNRCAERPRGGEA
jgi:hypothetical protein